jgi:hypothetical protein
MTTGSSGRVGDVSPPVNSRARLATHSLVGGRVRRHFYERTHAHAAIRALASRRGSSSASTPESFKESQTPRTGWRAANCEEMDIDAAAVELYGSTARLPSAIPADAS